MLNGGFKMKCQGKVQIVAWLMKLNENACIILFYISLYLGWQICKLGLSYFFSMRFLFLSTASISVSHTLPPPGILFTSWQPSSFLAELRDVNEPNRRNNTNRPRSLALKSCIYKSVKTNHVLFQDEMKSAICAQGPSRTKYFIDNKHCCDWCEAESPREGRTRRKGS